MPSIDVNPPQQTEESKNEETTTLSKPVIGIIYPPPEVRNIVDKTASFVARNGPEFEHRIRQNEVNNPKFNFLNPADAYHAYYQHKVKEFKEGKGQEPVAPKTQIILQRTIQEPVKIPEVFIPKDPPAEFEFIVDPPSISAYELDVVKLTAQFVARNGRQFLTTVMQREQRNYLFDFLRPQHSLFNYFTKLVEQYTKILIPPKNLKEKLATESQGYKKVLNDINYRVEWLKFQDREKKKEEDAAERERVAYAQIDWHDFVVVETVDFQQNETGNLPPPTTPDEVGARILNQERYERGEIAIDDAVEMEVESDEEPEEEEEEEEEEGSDEEKEEGPVVPPLPPPPKPALPLDDKEPQDMDEDSDEEERPPLPPPPPRPKVVPPPAPPPPPPPPPSEAPPLPPTPDQVVIRKDYNPKAKPVGQDEAPDQYMISPITKEKIPANKVQEHMRIGLLDPKWMEERQRTIAERQDQEEVLAAGSDIDVSLKQLAERRTDIFGIGTEETQIGKKIGEEEKRASKVPVMWDGHTASMEKVSQRARENISIEEQIHTIHKTKGLLPDEEKEKIGPAMPKSTPAPPPPPPVSVAPPPPPMSKPAPPPPPAPPVSRPPMPPMQPMPPRPPMGLPGMLMMQGPPMGHPMAMNPMMGMRPPMPPMQQQMGMGGPGMGGPMDAHQRPGMSQDEPPSKKQKTEDNLIPEEIFLQKNKGPVSVKVMVPNVSDKPEWKLNGQTLEFSLPLTDTISVLKAKLNEALGMPAGKQKLQYEGIFVKDSNTLAFYNFTVGAAVQLQMKERGGRKK